MWNLGWRRGAYGDGDTVFFSRCPFRRVRPTGRFNIDDFAALGFLFLQLLLLFLLRRTRLRHTIPLLHKVGAADIGLVVCGQLVFFGAVEECVGFFLFFVVRHDESASSLGEALRELVLAPLGFFEDSAFVVEHFVVEVSVVVGFEGVEDDDVGSHSAETVEALCCCAGHSLSLGGRA